MEFAGSACASAFGSSSLATLVFVCLGSGLDFLSATALRSGLDFLFAIASGFGLDFLSAIALGSAWDFSAIALGSGWDFLSATASGSRFDFLLAPCLLAAAADALELFLVASESGCMHAACYNKNNSSHMLARSSKVSADVVGAVKELVLTEALRSCGLGAAAVFVPLLKSSSASSNS